MKETFFDAYLEAALLSSMDENGDPLNTRYSVKDFHSDTLTTLKAECVSFVDSCREIVEQDLTAAGHAFWLTRKRGGRGGFSAGDWDEYSDELNDLAHEYRKIDLYIGDDKKIYQR